MKASTGSSERSTTKEVLNCLRILQRILPVIFEVEGESSVFELEVLWKVQEVEDDAAIDGHESETPQFVIEDDDDSEHGETKDEPSKQKVKQKKRLPSLGERLFGSLIDLLFCCGFTLPTKIQVDHHKINYIIWYAYPTVICRLY